MQAWRYGVLLVCLMLMACTSSENVNGWTGTNTQVARFHQQVAAGQFDAVWNTASGELRADVPEARMTALLEKVRRTLGPAKSSRERSISMSFGSSSTSVGGHLQVGSTKVGGLLPISSSSSWQYATATYHTEFAQGAGIEDFVYKMHGNELQLVGYRIVAGAISDEVASRDAKSEFPRAAAH